MGERRSAWRLWLTVAVGLQIFGALLFIWYRTNTHPLRIDNASRPQGEHMTPNIEHPSEQHDGAVASISSAIKGVMEVATSTRLAPVHPPSPLPVEPAHSSTIITFEPGPECHGYASSSMSSREPYSPGVNKLPYQRPPPSCRTFNSSVIEETITEYKSIIKDPDLFWLFQNTFPNTLDTTIKWRGYAADRADEELTFIITGDIDAMWLRDSADQVHVYAPFLKPSLDPNSLASLFRGAINLQARYIAKEPWCNAYQAPIESQIHHDNNAGPYIIVPHMDMTFCSTPNFELDSFGAFFLLSDDYYNRTQDAAFFGKYDWIAAVREILEVVKVQMEPFYDEKDGTVLDPAYKFNSHTQHMTGTLGIGGLGNPVRKTGMIKAPFRPSDDSGLYQFLVPSNMMFAGYLAKAAEIMAFHNSTLSKEMHAMSVSIRAAIEKYAVVPHPDGSKKKIYAFEVDGYGGQNLMDDANVPSLLSAPLLEYAKKGTPEWQVYLDTRAWVLSEENPWYIRGPTITGVGSPHTSVGKVWPMALIVRVLTSEDDEEIVDQVRQLLTSTGGLGLMHESVSSHYDTIWSRQWFAWANSLFGQMILDLHARKPHILQMDFQHPKA